MRVLILTADLAPDVWSGIGVAVAHDAHALAKRDCVVDVIVPEERCRRSSIMGVTIHALGRGRFPVSVTRPDCLHLHSLGLAELACQLCARWGVPLVYTAHSLLARELRDEKGAASWVMRQMRIFAEADHVFFLSAKEREEALLGTARLDGRSSVLANGLSPAPSCISDVAREPMLLFAGRFSQNKGIDLAIATMSALLDRRREMRCVVAGGHDPRHAWRDALRALADRHSGRVILPGWVEAKAMERLLRQASLLLVPSRYEPFGLAALEAMRLGCPVLASSGLRDLLGPGSGGIEVATYDVADWVDAADTLLSHEEKLRALSAAGPRFVDRHFSAAEHARKLHAMLEAVVMDHSQCGVAHVA